jgi:hypothetical protein
MMHISHPLSLRDKPGPSNLGVTREGSLEDWSMTRSSYDHWICKCQIKGRDLLWSMKGELNNALIPIPQLF